MLAGLAPLAFLATALGGIALTMLDLARLGDPDVGFFRTVDFQAQALHYGQGIFNDPDHGYTALLYTPGLAAVTSLLHDVTVWSGWAVVVATLAVLTLIGLAARLALPAAAGPREVLRALGVGALALWLIMPLVGDQLFAPAPEHPSWACALAGLVCAARAHRSKRYAVAAIVLLSAGFWIKQTSIVAPVVLTGWLIVLAAIGERRWRFVLVFLGALLAVNAAALGLVNLATDGRQFFYDFQLPSEHERIYGPRTFFSDITEGLLVGTVVAAGMWFAARGSLRARHAGTASLLVAFVVVGTVAAMWFRSKQGSEDNQYVGVAWAIGLLAAIAWRRAQDGPRTRRRADLVVAGALALALGGTAIDDSRLTLRQLKLDFVEVPADLRAVASTRSVYHPGFADLDGPRLEHVHQDYFNILDILAAGEQPRLLISQLANRRFDAAFSFAAVAGTPTLLRTLEEYASAYGRREEGYLWKLDRLMAAGYVRAPAGAPAGMLVRRAGPARPSGLEACFGPFDLAGQRWDIRRGGGLWCHTAQAGAVVTMRGTPAPQSELRTRHDVAVRGTLRVALARIGTSFLLRHGDRALSGRREVGRWRLTLAAGARHTTRLVPGGARLAIDLRPAGPVGIALSSRSPGRAVAAAGTGGERSPLELWATRGGLARFTLGDLRLSR